ncbi:glycerophosphodiester phosphodiesterase family protein [Leucobacter sp. W1478]|uniref:glycerophosphodiester phosphodiesterase family protein n=1 Tax=Leucobacter sp. W1478 TaxID=3439065 RepID=UPI003F35E5FC
MPHPYLSHDARPRVIAHRGLVTAKLAAQGVVENTRAAMTAAVAAGARYLESDCRLTSDGEVVLFHDVDLARVCGDPRPVAAVSYRELTSFFADRGGLLTLREAFEMFPEAHFNIDIKSKGVAEAAGRIIAPHAERVLVASFADGHRRAALQAVRSASGSGVRPATSPGRGALIRTLAALAAGQRKAAARALDGFDALQIPEKYGRVRVLTPRLIDLAESSGVEVHVWTVNDPAEMNRLFGMGVRGIITDRADLALLEAAS